MLKLTLTPVSYYIINRFNGFLTAKKFLIQFSVSKSGDLRLNTLESTGQG
ncbi:hypothetical protein LCGC14_1120260 [marine sediment metagenome]|uniref:Uncharacterized protein n=1 Tax=marine sediment metagenome TaxID=412755 RepID=A0A0F9MRZ1_9ZZZZ